MFRIVRVAAVFGLMLFGRATLEAQQATFTSGFEMVPLTVTVADGSGNYRTGLSAADFAVFEEGIPGTVGDGRESIAMTSTAIGIDATLIGVPVREPVHR